MSTITRWADEKLEESIRDEASLVEPWALIERFSGLVRESGTEDEWRAATYVQERLAALGIQHRVYEPELLISLPRGARLAVRTAGEDREIRAKTPSFSVATGDAPLVAEAVYISTGQAKGVSDLFGAEPDIPQGVEGKIVVTEGNPLPGKVNAFSRSGIAAMVFVGPGEHIHEGIVTPIWGAPDLGNADTRPQFPVVAVNHAEGGWLIEQCRSGRVELVMNTWLDEGWKRCPLVEASIPGTLEPERFVLVHGHIDSWHVGIGDNATGDAALLEIARLMHSHEHDLKRTVRVCWWPGHSHGRYAGSTWYADRFALDLDANCVAHINCDSPGCRWATVYENVMWMSETEDVARSAIEAAARQDAEGIRPIRAGDISFNNIGVSTFYMLSSTMPQDLIEEKAYYTVGGCGGNIEWHTEDDTLQIADKEILLKDIRVYATGVARVANAPVLPFDYRRTIDELVDHLRSYADAARGRVSFDVALDAAEDARKPLDHVYSIADEATSNGSDISDPSVKAANETLLRIGRRLVSVGYSERGKFRQDPALNIAPIPAVAPAATLGQLAEGSHQDRVTRIHVARGVNLVAWELRNVQRECELLLSADHHSGRAHKERER